MSYSNKITNFIFQYQPIKFINIGLSSPARIEFRKNNQKHFAKSNLIQPSIQTNHTDIETQQSQKYTLWQKFIKFFSPSKEKTIEITNATQSDQNIETPEVKIYYLSYTIQGNYIKTKDEFMNLLPPPLRQGVVENNIETPKAKLYNQDYQENYYATPNPQTHQSCLKEIKSITDTFVNATIGPNTIYHTQVQKYKLLAESILPNLSLECENIDKDELKSMLMISLILELSRIDDIGTSFYKINAQLYDTWKQKDLPQLSIQSIQNDIQAENKEAVGYHLAYLTYTVLGSDYPYDG
jgi:hypothetical protein